MKKIIAGNWKMNLLPDESLLLVNNLIKGISSESCRIVIAPPFLYLPQLKELLKDQSQISLAAQNCHHKKSGAYTGEVSPQMLRATGVEYVILGHSERRSLFSETDQWIAEKVKMALQAGLEVIFCCGETLKDRETNRHFSTVKSQIEWGLSSLSAIQMQRVCIAYEPVWAIGTGKTASPEQANEMHEFIRSLFVLEPYSVKVAEQIPILYGGSVKPANATELLAQPEIDGALVGGASLNAKDFLQIVRAAG